MNGSSEQPEASNPFFLVIKHVVAALVRQRA
jgi:hypothetical protein